MSNEHSVKACCYCHIYIITFLFSQHGHCYALGYGVYYVKIEDIRSPTLSPEIGLDEVEVLLEVVFEGLTTATGQKYRN